MKRDSFYADILIDKVMTRLDHCIVDLRGAIPQPTGKNDVVMSVADDTQYSSYNGKPLTEILVKPGEAEQWHREFAYLVTMLVLAGNDPMASEPAFRLGKVGALLRKVGAVREAKFCDLVGKANSFARGEDIEGSKLNAEGALYFISSACQ